MKKNQVNAPVKNPVMELMVPLTWNGCKVRVWWTHDGKLKHGEARELVRLKLDGVTVNDSVFDIVKHVGTMENVAAVEIVDINGQGVVYYPDWK